MPGPELPRQYGPVAAALALLLGVGHLAACGARPPRHAILVSVDTLRPDHLGVYGYARETSPEIDRIARGGVVFETALAPAPWTLPSHGSLLTGLYPSRHGLTAPDHRLPEDVPTLASRLAAAGFETAAVVNSIFVSERHGFDRGFQSFFRIDENVAARDPSREITDRAIAWLTEHRDRRTFLFVHYYDVHSDYRSLPEAEARFVRPYTGVVDGSTLQLGEIRTGDLRITPADVAHLVDLYDAGIHQMDSELGRLFAFLERGGWLEDTLLVVTSDHGEEFAEHGGVLHGRTQFDEVLRVPLVFRGPGVPAGRFVEPSVSLIDVSATLLALLGLPPLESSDGRDVSPLWSGAPEPEVTHGGERVLFAEAAHGTGAEQRRSARRGRFKLLADEATGARALYDLLEDPAERSDVSDAHPELTLDLAGQLERFQARARPPAPAPPLPQPEQLLLRELGYVLEGE